MKQAKKVYVCSECDHQTPRWMGQCPSCGAWNTLVEETYTQPAAASAKQPLRRGERAHAERFSDVVEDDCSRMLTGIGELDRVLGGGLVLGSAVLIAGEPGIGKSTLLMQLCGKCSAEYKLLYVSGEESLGQLKLRAKRLGCDTSEVLVLSENSLEAVLDEYERVSPDVVIVDSIQTMVSAASDSSAGSISQVRECSSRFIERAKTDGAAVLLVGHVNKEGGIAGPKVLEHMVDAVLSFEGDRSQSHRIVRAVKNRFGSTNEIGVFEMTDSGLCEVKNPSEMMISGRPENASGSVITCTFEGTRPILAEIQALSSPTGFGNARRMATGLDYNRAVMLVAILEKKLGYNMQNQDVYLNIAGGLKISEPATDLAAVMAIASNYKNFIVDYETAVLGEVGLTGEVRSITYPEKRVNEAKKLGFSRIILPADNLKSVKNADIEIIGVKTVHQAISYCAKSGKKAKIPE